MQKPPLASNARGHLPEASMDGYRDDLELNSKGGKIVRYLVIAAAVIVYGLVFYRLYIAGDSSVSSDILLDRHGEAQRIESFLQISLPKDKTSPAEEIARTSSDGHPPYFSVYTFSPTVTMDGEGRIQMRNAVYLETAASFQFSLKINTKYYDVDENGLLKDAVCLYVQHGGGTVTRHEAAYYESSARSYYTTTRYGFNDVNFNVGSDKVWFCVEKGGKTLLKITLSDSTVTAKKENPFTINYKKV